MDVRVLVPDIFELALLDQEAGGSSGRWVIRAALPLARGTELGPEDGEARDVRMEELPSLGDDDVRLKFGCQDFPHKVDEDELSQEIPCHKWIRFAEATSTKESANVRATRIRGRIKFRLRKDVGGHEPIRVFFDPSEERHSRKKHRDRSEKMTLMKSMKPTEKIKTEPMVESKCKENDESAMFQCPLSSQSSVSRVRTPQPVHSPPPSLKVETASQSGEELPSSNASADKLAPVDGHGDLSAKMQDTQDSSILPPPLPQRQPTTSGSQVPTTATAPAPLKSSFSMENILQRPYRSEPSTSSSVADNYPIITFNQMAPPLYNPYLFAQFHQHSPGNDMIPSPIRHFFPHHITPTRFQEALLQPPPRPGANISPPEGDIQMKALPDCQTSPALQSSANSDEQKVTPPQMPRHGLFTPWLVHDSPYRPSPVHFNASHSFNSNTLPRQDDSNSTRYHDSNSSRTSLEPSPVRGSTDPTLSFMGIAASGVAGAAGQLLSSPSPVKPITSSSNSNTEITPPMKHMTLLGSSTPKQQMPSQHKPQSTSTPKTAGSQHHLTPSPNLSRSGSLHNSKGSTPGSLSGFAPLNTSGLNQSNPMIKDSGYDSKEGSDSSPRSGTSGSPPENREQKTTPPGHSSLDDTSPGTAVTRRREKSWLPCEVCGKKFDRPSLLKRHMRTHTGEKPHACDLCSKAFSTSSSLNTHRRIHSGEKPHQCPVCGKCFTASSNLYYHRMTHKKEKPHKCTQCSKSFPTPGDLKSHMYVHNGKWPHTCQVCNRGFSKLTNLKNHMLLHSGDKPHECPICNKKFALACNLKTHVKTHEEDSIPSKCVRCHRIMNLTSTGFCQDCLLGNESAQQPQPQPPTFNVQSFLQQQQQQEQQEQHQQQQQTKNTSKSNGKAPSSKKIKKESPSQPTSVAPQPPGLNMLPPALYANQFYHQLHAGNAAAAAAALHFGMQPGNWAPSLPQQFGL